MNASVGSFDGNLNSATIHGLRPSQAYFCSVRAENEIGLSESSDHVQLFTKQEGKKIVWGLYSTNLIQILMKEIQCSSNKIVIVCWSSGDPNILSNFCCSFPFKKNST